MVDYLQKISEFTARLTFDDLPLEVVSRAKQVMADAMAVIAAGYREAEVQKLCTRLTVGAQQHQSGSAMLLGRGFRVDPLNAALINGTAGTFLELDEGNQFARGHPAIHVVPVSLAVAESERLTGRDLILALVLGYEIGARIGIAAKIRMSMHPHGTWGTTGAAVAVGKLMKYDAGLFREMVNISSSLALATSRKTMLEGGTVRNAYSGISNYMGLMAHHLAQSGFTGEADGLGTVYGQVISETFDTDVLLEDLGSRYEIARNYFKIHACCRYNHSTLDALEIIADRLPDKRIPADRVTRVEVKTYSLAAQLCDQNPQNMLAAKFSIPFAVATYLTHGQTGVDCFRSEKVAEPAIKDLAQKVDVVEDPQLTAMMPDRRPARVKVFLDDGSVLEAETFLNRGDFEDPYPVEKLEEKYYLLAAPVWGRERAARVFDLLQRLESIENINELTDQLLDSR